MRGRVTRRKHGADGNPIGRSYASPALDTRLYIVEFDDNDRTELTANNHVCQQETDPLAPTIAAPNALEVKVVDVLSAYTTAWTTEEVQTLTFWMKKTYDPNFNDYFYILVYVDDSLSSTTMRRQIFARLNEYLPIQPSSVGDPDIYHGA